MISLRPASDADAEWLFELHRAAMRTYVERTWGWDETWQARFFKDHYDLSTVQVIQSGARDVGVVRVSDEPSQIVLEMIELLPEFQGQGIGTGLIRALLSRAKQRRVPVVLRVLKVNSRAKALYQRLGFQSVGETETHDLMRYDPAAAAGDAA